MFTLKQIDDAHAKVTSGADFPRYIQDIKTLGVLQFQTFVTDGHTVYFGDDNYRLQSEVMYNELKISTSYDKRSFEEGLKNHQEGKNNFFEFCSICANAGIVYWIMDIENMSCTYYTAQDSVVLSEKIPQ